MELDKPNSLGASVVVGLAVLVPWLTWWLLTTPNANMAVTETPIFLCGLGLLLLLSTYVGQADAPLGLLAAYMVIRVLPLTSPYAFEAAYLTVFGACVLVVLSRMPVEMIRPLRAMVLAGGCLQAGYGILQASGFDPMWIGWHEAVNPALGIRGTLGNSDFFGAYCAMLLACSPIWIMPVFLVGLVLSKSVLACGAAVIGLAVRYRHHWIGPTMATLGVSSVIWYAFHRPGGWNSLWHRTDVWTYAVQDWWAQAPILGFGTGQWPLRIPQAQLTQTVSHVSSDVFVQAHNEYLQLLYDGGVIAVCLLGWWAWTHRALWTGPSAGVIAVVTVNCLANFPFHVGTTALLALVMIGLALAEERTQYEEVFVPETMAGVGDTHRRPDRQPRPVHA